MKVFAIVVLASLAALASAGFEDKAKMMVKKWMIGKAMESCFGPENTKKFMMAKRKAVAECSGMDAPELDLPFFQSPYRVVSGLMKGASSSDRWMEEMMKKFMFEKMMKRFGRRHHDDDDDDMPFYKSGGAFRGRFKRDHHTEEEGMELSLGDRLIESLQQRKKSLESEIGNQTCVCRKLGILDEDNELDLDAMLKHMEEFELDPWLKEHIIADKKKCYELSQSLPQSILDGCVTGPKMVKYKMFKRCLKESKVWTCIKYDMRQKLEENFGSVEELTQTTGLKEEELYPLTMQLMQGH